MTIKANILRDVHGNITVQMEGDFNYEYSGHIRQQLHHITKNYPQASLTIDMAGIDFVGSSGICHFVETLRAINRAKDEQVTLSNVKPEFRKVFKLYTVQESEFLFDEFDFENDETASIGMWANRDRTFEN